MGAYKQLLASDIIVSPLEVHKDFTFQGSSELTASNVGINRLLGQNITQFDFSPNLDPVTGNYYDVTTPGTQAYLTLAITPFHNEVASVGSSSFTINDTIFIITGSGVLPPNGFNTIYVRSGSSVTATTNNITSSLNYSSSLFTGIYNITSSNLSPSFTSLFLENKTSGYIGNYNYVISSSTTTYFLGGTNDIVSGSYQYRRLVYDSIKQLYYSNYLTSSYSDRINRPQLVPGRDEEGNRYVGEIENPAYDNYLQTTLTYPRYFPTESNSYIGVLSIPSNIFGDYIEPHSFRMSYDGNSFYDDGEGNILTGSNIVGNIIYTHGLITLTGNQDLFEAATNASNNPQNVFGAKYADAIYGSQYVYGTPPVPINFANTTFGFVDSDNFTCSFSSSYTIYETQYKCTIRENEFNFTLNPSTISGSFDTGSTAGTVYGYVTESYFSPYITTVGLYDEQQNLLAIGKLAQPLPTSPTTDTTILINIDK